MLRPPVIVTTPTALRGLVPHLLASPRIAVDTESNSFFAYHERMCLLQISTYEDDYVVDPFTVGDLSPLSEVFENPGIEKIFHAAQEDIRLIKKTINCGFENLFDTMVSARIAGKKEIGLASLLQKHLHVTLDKKLQRSDWGRRPLTSAQYEYAAKDTHYLIRLREILHHELVRMDRLEEALEQFELLTDYDVPDKAFDPEAYRRFKGARELDPQRLAILRELYLYREDRARAINRPVFMVLPELLLVRLAQQAPADHEALKKITGVTSFILTRHGRGILDSVADGKAAAPVSALPSAPRQSWSGKQMARYERLRAWRAAKATERGVDPDVVLPNKALKAISILDDPTEGSVGETEGMSPHKMSLYWPELEALLRSKPTQ